MPTPHSSLTGASLHEPKGAAAAAVDKVYVADGAGSGVWQKLTADQLTGTGNPFGGQLLHVEDNKSSGTSGGSFDNGSWKTRTLNTSQTNQIASASLASNRISLPAGTYVIEASAPAYAVNNHQTRLQNITAGTTLATGTTARSLDTANTMTRSELWWRGTLGATTSIELQHRSGSTQSSNGFGDAGGFGTEVYAVVRVWKVG